MASWNKGISLTQDWLRLHATHQGDECLMWPFARDNHGYALVGVNRRSRKAARVMCQMVHGPAPTAKHHAAHSCGNGQLGCVHPQHLSWKTPKENMADSVRLGAVGTPLGRSTFKLTEEHVAQIWRLKGTMSYSKIGPMFGVKPKQIGKIFRGEQWVGGKRAKPGFAHGDPRNHHGGRKRVAV